MRRGAGSAVLGCAGGLVLVITALALALSSRQHSSMLVDSEWAGGSSRWAQSDTPVSSSTPSQSARWAQSDTPLAAPPQSDAWSAFRKSQSFLPARLQKHSPEGGVETDGNRAQRRAGPVSRSGAEQDAIEADAAELIKKVMLFGLSLAAWRCASVNTFCMHKGTHKMLISNRTPFSETANQRDVGSPTQLRRTEGTSC